MSIAPITAVAGDTAAPLSPPPSTAAAPSFSDMLTSATSSLAAFALLPTAGTDALANAGDSLPPPRKKDPDSDNAAVPMPLPAPVQTPPAPAATNANSDASTRQSSKPDAAQAQTPGSAPSSAATDGSTGAGTAAGQNSNGVTLPAMAAELNTRIALGAQALLSQPGQALSSLPHGAPPTTAALVPNLGAAAHGATADPTAMLPKAPSAATAAAAVSSNTMPTLEAALQSSAAQTPSGATTAGSSLDPSTLVNSSDLGSQSATDNTAGTTPPPTSVPLPAAEAAAQIDTAPASAIAASALDQVAASLMQGGKLGLSQIEIQLKPAALGTVDVKLELTHDGRVAAVISADRSDTLMQLQRGAGELQQALRDAGLQTDSGSLSFNLRGDPQAGNQGSRQSGYAPAVTSVGSGDDLLAAPSAAAALASQSAHSGLLNIQV